MKHKILTIVDLMAVCGICGKKQSLKDEILASQKDPHNFVPFNVEPCDPNMKYVYPENTHLTLRFQMGEHGTPRNELQEAFNDLMKEFPDGSAR